jgi:hypothetical protein
MAVRETTTSEVLGATVNVCIDGVMSVFQSRMRTILDDHDIEQPDPHPDEWYPLDNFLSILEVVETDVGENALTKIGESTPRFVDWPTNPENPEAALQGLVDIFEQNHRNVTGEYVFEQTGESTGQITSTSPYPEAWERGFMKGTAELHGSPYAQVSLVEESADQTVFTVEW